ncbi:WhiB family transcriptional regulator, partial [Streptomyces zhihengii]
MPTTPPSARAAHESLTGHPYYRYRGCAPDPDQPGRAAGNPAVPVTAWDDPTADGGEDQKARNARRAAAIDVCVECPVMVACLTYAMTVTDGRLTEPHGIFGGTTGLERHRRHIKRVAEERRRSADEELVAQLATVQRMAVLTALAGQWEPHLVARAAGVDVRTANWQRSKTVTLLGLDRSASRMELLA